MDEAVKKAAMNVQPTQLALPIQLPDDETFASFYGEGNTQLLATLRGAAEGVGEPFIYIWANSGEGRSHLLHAVLSEVSTTNKRCAYLPLDMAGLLSCEIFTGMEQLDLVCIDNLDLIMGMPDWEQAVFNFYNRWRDKNKGTLIVTSSVAPANLKCDLPDLASRLQWGLTYRINAMPDAAKISALQLRAELRGLRLPIDVGRFLLNRLSRDMTTLVNTLDKLDKASISAQRRLTIPFIKDVLAI